MLPADNITDYIDGIKTIYRADAGGHAVGDRVVLFNQVWEHEFVVIDILDAQGSILVLRDTWRLKDRGKQHGEKTAV